MSQPKPIPTPGAYPSIPNTGVRPTTNPTPAPSPGPAPGTETDQPKQGTAAPGQPGLAQKALDAIPGVGAISDLSAGITAVRNWVSNRHNWVRVAWFGGGVVMFTVGAVMVGERPLSNAVSSVAAPVGKVVKSAYKG